MLRNNTTELAFSQRRHITTGCAFADDNAFGPAIAKQCRAFDFTLLFEQAFLSLVPSILLVLGSVIRSFGIFNHDAKTQRGGLHTSKLV